jgi:hypothetical protein
LREWTFCKVQPRRERPRGTAAQQQTITRTDPALLGWQEFAPLALDQQQGNDRQGALAGAGIAQKRPQGDLRLLPGQNADGMGIFVIKGNLPDIWHLVVDQSQDATHQLARPGVVLESSKLLELV